MAVELEAFDGLSRRAIINRGGPGLAEGRGLLLAGTAHPVFAFPGGEHFAAAKTPRTGRPLNFPLALRTHRHPGLFPHRGPAEQTQPGQKELQDGEAEALELGEGMDYQTASLLRTPIFSN